MHKDNKNPYKKHFLPIFFQKNIYKSILSAKISHKRTQQQEKPTKNHTAASTSLKNSQNHTHPSNAVTDKHHGYTKQFQSHTAIATHLQVHLLIYEKSEHLQSQIALSSFFTNKKNNHP